MCSSIQTFIQKGLLIAEDSSDIDTKDISNTVISIVLSLGQNKAYWQGLCIIHLFIYEPTVSSPSLAHLTGKVFIVSLCRLSTLWAMIPACGWSHRSLAVALQFIVASQL